MIDPSMVHGAEEIAALPGDTLSIKGNGLQDDDLSGIARLVDLSELYLDGCQDLGDRALAQVSGLPQLRVFYTSGRHITDDGLAALATCGRLSEFGLDAPVTGEGFRHLGILPDLAEIHLPAFPNGTRAGVEALAALPSLRKLCFYGVAGLDDSWLTALAASGTLRELVLMGCREVTNEGIEACRAERPELSIEVM